MTDEREYDDLARELHATRAEPRPEYARELDQRAATWLRERPRRRFPSLRVAIPAAASTAAAAAVVIALAVSGGSDDADEPSPRLEVAVLSDQGAAEALGAPVQRDSAASRAEGAFAAPQATRVEEGEPVVVRYFFTAPTDAHIALGGREADVTVDAGAGRVEISTDGLPAGAHRLVITIPGSEPERERIEIDG
jgi:hypothetical protein